jgi:leader peptidase (prepilin peptidase)/N-methyltransferase
MPSPLATGVAAAVCVAASPYLARLTLSVPEREHPRWWRGEAAGRRRVLLTALAAAVLGALAGAAAGWTALLPAFVLVALCGAPLIVIDFEHHRLPNRLVFSAAAGGAVLLTAAAAVRGDWHAWLRGVEAAAAVFAVLFLLAFISPRSFGFGDVKLGAVLGGYLGWFGWLDVYYGIFAGFLLGALVALALLATRRASLKTAMAFGPMLLLGALVVLAFDLTPSLA